MRALLACLSLSVLLGACASAPSTSLSTGSGEVTQETGAATLGASALPPGAKIKGEQSLIIGAGEQWVGRVVADVGRDADATLRFYLETYPAQGWTLVSAVRSKNSLMVFTKQDRTATVEVADSGMLGSGSVTLTVSPRNAAVMAPRKP